VRTLLPAARQLPLTSLAAVHDLVEGLLHLLADGEDEVQHLAPVASHVMAQRLQLRLVVVDAAGGRAYVAETRMVTLLVELMLLSATRTLTK
jgi:hypothetical protein